MRVVLDTNVLVSGLLHPEGVPGQLIEYLFSRAFVVLYDGRMLDEYREVLARPRLDIPQDAAAAVCAFIEVAAAGGADAIVTGNAAHFPGELLPVRVQSPRAFLGLLEEE
jgi:predicted nucleic acid-binding protein